LGPVTLLLPSQSFTIHGLWSQDRNSPRIFGDFDVDLISGDHNLADKMMNYMPPRTKSNQKSPFFLWDHEWAGQNDAHGDDYGNVVL
jgi:ribonuclease I